MDFTFVSCLCMKSFVGIAKIVDVCLLLNLQTGKINQGNIALKRVVESIANGDSHVPFRDSKLTMLLQVKFHSCLVSCSRLIMVFKLH